MQEPNTDPAEAVTNAFEGVQFSVAFRAEPDEILTAVKAYANAFAAFQLSRVTTNLRKQGYESAAKAVELQRDVLQALDRVNAE